MRGGDVCRLRLHLLGIVVVIKIVGSGKGNVDHGQGSAVDPVVIFAVEIIAGINGE